MSLSEEDVAKETVEMHPGHTLPPHCQRGTESRASKVGVDWQAGQSGERMPFRSLGPNPCKALQGRVSTCISALTGKIVEVLQTHTLNSMIFWKYKHCYWGLFSKIPFFITNLEAEPWGSCLSDGFLFEE